MANAGDADRTHSWVEQQRETTDINIGVPSTRRIQAKDNRAQSEPIDHADQMSDVSVGSRVSLSSVRSLHLRRRKVEMKIKRLDDMEARQRRQRAETQKMEEEMAKQKRKMEEEMAKRKREMEEQKRASELAEQRSALEAELEEAALEEQLAQRVSVVSSDHSCYPISARRWVIHPR